MPGSMPAFICNNCIVWPGQDDWKLHKSVGLDSSYHNAIIYCYNLLVYQQIQSPNSKSR